VKGKKMQFVEKECCLEFEEKKFCSGGSWLLQNKKTGKLEAGLYENQKENQVTDWHGKTKFQAHYGNEWISNFGDKRQVVYCWINDKKFSGIWYSKDFNQYIHFKEIKS
jgi:hypothetical protein